ncbi:hypothetical protein G6F59_018732 [Rhizopus arrhizus]|nr:hypothetical protein G6F59_018732 [Rhizopus arrhizus]
MAVAGLAGGHRNRVERLDDLVTRDGAIAVPVHVLLLDALGDGDVGVPGVAQPRQHDQHQRQQRLATRAELAAQDHGTRRMVAPSEDSFSSMFS